MSEETRRVLEMLSQGKITVEEADRLMQAVGAPRPEPSGVKSEPADQPAPKFFRITVNQSGKDGGRAETVNVRVPMSVVRGGLRLGSLIPGLMGERTKQRLRDKGVDLDFSKLDFTQLDTLIRDLGELTIDVDDRDSQVRIRCE
jgi:SHOCT-like protein